MKKIIILFISLICISCSNIEKNQWTGVSKVLETGFEFEEGDILILNKLPNIYSIFGHSGIVLENGSVGEYPIYGYGFIEVGLADWLESSVDRKIVVLRAPNLTNEQKDILRESVDKYAFSKYGIFNKKMGTDEFYCSSFIWRIYYDMGIDLDKDFTYFVVPYDFFNTKLLKKQEIY